MLAYAFGKEKARGDHVHAQCGRPSEGIANVVDGGRIDRGQRPTNLVNGITMGLPNGYGAGVFA